MRLSQDALYEAAAARFGPALERIARGSEANPEQRRDLLQEIHLALWQSFERFDGKCSERTWVYRVAHNVAASHCRRAKRNRLIGSDELDGFIDPSCPDPEAQFARRHAFERLMSLVRGLGCPDRQIVMLYLEGLDARAIGEISGLSPGAVATKVSRLKAYLSKRMKEVSCDG